MTRLCTAIPGCREAAVYQFRGTGDGRKITTYACVAHHDAGWSTVRNSPKRDSILIEPCPLLDDQPTLFD